MIDTIIRYKYLCKFRESESKKLELKTLLDTACRNTELTKFVELNYKKSDVRSFLKQILAKISEKTEALMIEADKASADINKQRRDEHDKMVKKNAKRRRDEYSRKHPPDAEATTCGTGPCVVQLRL